jgi:hypothetical protein
LQNNLWLYQNDSLKITLKKHSDVQNWLHLKKISIDDGDFGVSALRDFNQNEFITAYMGKRIDYTYMYNDILSIPTSKKNTWYTGRICWGKGSIGEEVLCNYNRDGFCVGSNTLVQWYSVDMVQNTKCMKCEHQKNIREVVQKLWKKYALNVMTFPKFIWITISIYKNL